MADTILGFVGIFHVAAIVILGGNDDLKAFSPQQLAAMSSLALKLHGSGYTISMVFFGMGCIVLGDMLHRARHRPRLLGSLLALAGICYLFRRS